MNKLFSILLLLTLFISGFHSSAQWTSMDGPYGDVSINTYISNGTVEAIATSRGVYIKKGTANWVQILDKYVIGLEFYGDSILVSGQSGLIDISTNKFHKFTIPPQYSYGHKNLLVAHGTDLFLSTSSGVFKSSDKGATFNNFNQNLPIDTSLLSNGSTTYHLGINGMAMAFGKLTIITSRGHIYTHDLISSNWQFVNSSGTLSNQYYNKNSFSFQNGILYHISSYAIYRSLNANFAWDTIYTSSNIYPRTTIIDFLDDNDTLYMATKTNGIQKKSSSSSSFQSFNQGFAGFFGGEKYASMITRTKGLLYAGLGTKGLYSFNGSVWTIKPLPGLIETMSNNIVGAKNRLLASDNNGFYRFGQNGWLNISPGKDSGYVYADLAVMGDTIFGLRRNHSNSNKWSLFYSTNFGTSWKKMQLPLLDTITSTNNNYKVQLRTGSAGAIYITYREMVSKTTDLGVSYTQMPFMSGRWSACNIMDVLEFDGCVYMIACNLNTVYKWSVADTTWVTSTRAVTQLGYPITLAKQDSVVFVTGTKHTYRKNISSDWDLTGPIHQPFTYGGYASTYNTLFISLGNRISYTEDLGDTWSFITDTLPSSAKGMCISQNTLLVNTEKHGVYSHALPSQIGATEFPLAHKKQLDIFPNPTKETFTINLKNDLNGSYTLCNLLGKEVRKGNFTSGKPITISNIALGTYLIRVEADEKVWQQRLMLGN